MFSALLLGACVAQPDSETSARIEDNVTPINVVDEVEMPTPTPDYVDFGTVIITGVQIPGRESTATHIDVRTALEVDAWPYDIEFCAVQEGLDSADICSSLCDPDGFIARVHDQGGKNPGGCQNHTCTTGTTIVDVQVCLPPSS
jgi:hypothetical protein